jgi:hypothetical protein
MLKTPRFKILSQGPDRITIRDVGPHDRFPTVTNAAEETVAELFEIKALGDRQLLCYDTDGELSELKHDGRGHFTGFAPYVPAEAQR